MHSEGDLLDSLDLPINRAIELVRPLVPLDRSITELVDRFALVCWSNLVEPGDSTAQILIQSLGADSALAILARAVTSKEHPRIPEFPVELTQKQLEDAFERWRPRFDAKRFRSSFDVLGKIGSRVITNKDSEWPAGLNDLGWHAPLLLFARGGTLDVCSQSIALVGSRAVTPYGRWVTKDLAEQSVANALTVVSGGAFGVDAIAHQSTMAANGFTVALMAGGLDRYYPTGNEPLLRQVEQSGAVCAEVPPGFTPTKWRFLQRNRLIAAISQATVIVEAGFRSGSINTANHASQLGRVVAAIPGSIASANSAGCHRVIQEAKATLVTSVGDVLRLLGREEAPAAESQAISDEQLRVYDALGSRGGSEQVLAKRSGLSLSQVYVALAELEMLEYAVRHELKWMRSRLTLKR